MFGQGTFFWSAHCTFLMTQKMVKCRYFRRWRNGGVQQWAGHHSRTYKLDITLMTRGGGRFEYYGRNYRWYFDTKIVLTYLLWEKIVLVIDKIFFEITRTICSNSEHWIKVRTSWQIQPQHQSTYLGGPESA